MKIGTGWVLHAEVGHGQPLTGTHTPMRYSQQPVSRGCIHVDDAGTTKITWTIEVAMAGSLIVS